jgi:hypothetical protein
MIKLALVFFLLFISIGSLLSFLFSANKQQKNLFLKYCATLTLLSAISLGLMIFISNF